jgi:hypothetical protein
MINPHDGPLNNETFTDWLDLYCDSPMEAKKDPWFLRQSKQQQYWLIEDGKTECKNRKEIW